MAREHVLGLEVVLADGTIVTSLNKMLKMGVRAEQQAFAKWGLNFVIEEYLPRKLRERKKFLP